MNVLNQWICTDSHGEPRRQSARFVARPSRFIALACLLMVSPLSAKQLSSGADFLKIDAGARGAALGQSYTALADDYTALFWNPAGLGFMKQVEVGYQRIMYLDDMYHNYVAMGIPIPTGENAKTGLGFGFISLGVPPFDSTNGLEPSVSATDMAGLFGFAFEASGFSTGLTAKYISRDVAGEKGQGFLGDIGIMGRAGSVFSFGIAGCNLGPELRFTGGVRELPPSLLRVGLAVTPIESIDHALRITTDHSIQFFSQNYRFGAGLEYTYSQLFSVRGGYCGDHDRSSYSVGGGLDLEVFRLDYAFLPFGTLGDTHRMSALIRFGKPDKPGRGLRTPTRLEVDPYDRCAIVKWRAAYSKDVVGYHFYVRKPGLRDFRRFTKNPIDDTVVKLRRLKNGEKYEVGITSVTAAGRESRMVRILVETDPTRPMAQMELVPTGLRAELKGEGLVLTWKISENAKGYYLYLADPQGRADKRLSESMIREPQVTLEKLMPDKTYRFLVTAVGRDGAESKPSALLETRLPSATVVSQPAQAPEPTPEPARVAVLMPPTSLTVTPGPGSATITWSAVPGAAGYYVYVSTDDGGTYKKLMAAPLKDTKAVLKPLKSRAYLFAVSSVDANGQETGKALAAPVIPLASQ